MNATDASVAAFESRVLVLSPGGQDAPLVCSALERERISAKICSHVAALRSELELGAGAVLVAEEALAEGGWQPLADYIALQPAWSDLPVLVMTLRGMQSLTVTRMLGTLANVTLIERPVRPVALISAVRAALRARDRQYQVRAHLIERKQTEDMLREGSRRKDEFLAALAHELRNPLAPIRNAVELMRITDDPDMRWAREVIERQSLHLARLVDDLLDVSRITRGQVELRRERVALADVLLAAVDPSRPLIEGKQHTLEIDAPAQRIVLDADPVRLAQCISNLLNNAARYTPAGGKVSLTCRTQGTTLAIRVRDSGIGMPQELLPNVFDMFIQGGASKEAQGGLGIGLALVRGFVQMHGGSVRVSSEGVGKGSEFAIEMPVVVEHAEAPAAVSAPHAAEPKRANGKSTRILVADDNEDGVETLKLLLTMLGNEVCTARDGVEALEAAKNFEPSIAILDLGMPRVDGYEAARRIRELPGAAAMKLIALTGWGQQEAQRRSREAGYDHHLVKPVDLDVLQRLLAS
jgi:signal transduction histidine kinase